MCFTLDVTTAAMADSNGFQFSAGSLCLDFVATRESWRDHERDLLDTPAQLSDWLAALALPVPAGGLTGGDLASARDLRDAVEGLARALIAGAPADPDHVRSVNAFARRPTPVFLLRSSGRDRTVVEEVDASGALSVVARDAIHLFTGASLSRLRECARDRCSTLFYDRSPSGQRRWCAMKGCGERVASASYRRRRAAKEPSLEEIR